MGSCLAQRQLEEDRTRTNADREVGERESPANRTALILFGLGCIAVMLGSVPIFGYGDFVYFYQDVETWRVTGILYPPESGTRLNLNLPHVAVLFAVFGDLQLDAAWACWSLIQIGLACDILRRVLARGVLRPGHAAMLLVAPATLAQIALAQLGWMLAWLVTLAWEDRSRHPVRSAAWIGVAAALKPFVLVLVLWWCLRARWKEAVAALAVMLCISVAGVLCLGTNAYETWSQRVGNVSWDHLALNWSLLGAWRRAVSPDVPTVWFWGGECLALAAVLAILSRVTPDRAGGWVLALAAGILLSPLGWGYYGWVLLAPTVDWLYARRQRHAGLMAALALVWLPSGIAPLLSLNTVGLVALACFAAGGALRCSHEALPLSR